MFAVRWNVTLIIHYLSGQKNVWFCDSTAISYNHIWFKSMHSIGKNFIEAIHDFSKRKTFQRQLFNITMSGKVDAYIWEEFIYQTKLRLYESLLVQCRAFHISISVLSKCIQLGWISHETCMIWAEGENVILEGNAPVLHITGEGGGGCFT